MGNNMRQIAINLNDYLPLSKSECFTHIDDDGTYRHFPVEVMYKIGQQWGGKCRQIELCPIPITPKQAEWIRRKAGIEQDRLARLISPYLERPMIGIMWPEGTLTLIDGNHRYIKLHEAGVTEAPCYIFMYPAWESLLIELPNDRELTVDKRSGLIEREREQANGR